MSETTMLERVTQLKSRAAGLEAMVWFTQGPCADKFTAMDESGRTSYLLACLEVADECGGLATEIRRALNDSVM
ncbi:MAG: hypothetical protein KDH93_19190 [Rhodoferax sp.]|nr:hypothetical protein [Rhodoferax sp.]MCB2007150.1 hypothetical protein [Rhodoferax sp.]MCB2027794.1 hypothetical protein [Rhodoferax sp.]MCP5262401.1 hypothetical protein [Rhodoferax sp.]